MAVTDRETPRLTNAEIFEQQRFRRDDPIWQLINAAITWASWAYSEQAVNQDRLDRCWAAVEDKEQQLRQLLAGNH